MTWTNENIHRQHTESCISAVQCHTLRNVYAQILSHVKSEMIHHLCTFGPVKCPSGAPLTVSNTNTHVHTLHADTVLVYKVILTAPLAHNETLPSHTSLSVAMPIDSVIYCCLTTLSSSIHILIAICS